MIDLHAHVLPGFDDGAEDWRMSVKMCRQAAADGTKGLVATPHFFRGLFPTPEAAAVGAAVVELQTLCEKALISGFQIYLGADCHLHAEVIANAKSGRVPTLNGSRYLLLELPDGPLPPRIKNLIFDMNVAGITPIITHPERNSVLSAHPSVLYELIRGGAYAQVTGGSLTGLFGAEAQRAAELMVTNGLVQVIASDAHDPERRPAVLSEAVAAAERLIGSALAGQMVKEVPRAILANKPISFPEPVRPQRRGKASLWRRLLGN